MDYIVTYVRKAHNMFCVLSGLFWLDLPVTLQSLVQRQSVSFLPGASLLIQALDIQCCAKICHVANYSPVKLSGGHCPAGQASKRNDTLDICDKDKTVVEHSLIIKELDITINEDISDVMDISDDVMDNETFDSVDTQESVSDGASCSTESNASMFNTETDIVFDDKNLCKTDSAEVISDCNESMVYEPTVKKARFSKFDNESYDKCVEYKIKPKGMLHLVPMKSCTFIKMRLLTESCIYRT